MKISLTSWASKFIMLTSPAPVPQKGVREPKGVKAMLEKGDGSMATYVDAVEDFRESATAFIQHLNLLAQAREVYQQAMTASAELRSVLDAGDENLRTLMTQLEQAFDLHTDKPALDKKKPERMKVEAIRASSGSAGAVRTFP
jgi:hypothetical protein